ncbi:MAG: DnaB-like helicase C-terminal domain-containing protein, partial [Desulfatiglandales bacterium]
LEQDADLIMFLYKDDTQSDSNTLKVEIAKNRNGPMGSFRLVFVPNITRFYPYADLKSAAAM